jgi:TetR/AcrR family transcriptional regulator
VNTVTSTLSTAAALSVPARHRLSSEDRRSQLIACAVDLFAKRGFSGTRTKDIAAACGVSEGILFHHFATKEDLYHAILDTHEKGADSEGWMSEMQQLADQRDDAGFLRCLVTRLIESFREEASFHRLMIFARLEGHSMVDLVNQRMGKACLNFMRDYVIQRQQEGAFRGGNPDALVLFMFATPIQYSISRYVFEMDLLHLPDKQVGDELVPLILAGLQVGPNRKASPAKAVRSPKSVGSKRKTGRK